MVVTFRGTSAMACFQKKSGFTLIEVLIVVLLLGIIAMQTLPSLQSGLTGARLAGAATEIVAALEFAQATAMSTGGRTRVTVNASTDSILVERYKPDIDLLGGESELDEGDVEGGSFSAMEQPANRGADYEITLADEDRFGGVDITASTFGLNDFVTFDGLGTPSSGGSVTLTLGSRTITVSVNALSGKITSSG